jgi:hypothetical protein
VGLAYAVRVHVPQVRHCLGVVRRGGALEVVPGGGVVALHAVHAVAEHLQQQAGQPLLGLAWSRQCACGERWLLPGPAVAPHSPPLPSVPSLALSAPPLPHAHGACAARTVLGREGGGGGGGVHLPHDGLHLHVPVVGVVLVVLQRLPVAVRLEALQACGMAWSGVPSPG